MTFETCETIIESLRRKQGTSCPLVRVDYAGTIFQGRLTRSDSDRGKGAHSPYGVLVLENPGLARAPETILQIADIPEDGLHELVDG